MTWRPCILAPPLLLLLLLLLLVPLSLASAPFPLTDEEYFQMPQLFHLDEYEGCLSQRRGQFCLGTFHLSPGNNTQLYQLIQKFSSDSQNFNHTRLHRGYCLSSRCGNTTAEAGGAGAGGEGMSRRFERCVQRRISARYGLRATLAHLDYCKTAGTQHYRSIDTGDLVFAGLLILILLLNVIGTLYDVFRTQNDKPNIYLRCWSVLFNWKRLTTTYKDGTDKRLSALKPLQGIKYISLSLVIIAHSSFSHYLGYTYNPIFFEKFGRQPFFYLYFNGTVIVQTFIMISSFLLAYNLLLNVEKNSNITFRITLLPYCLLLRLFRILPLYLFVLGLASTWWPRLHDGALWSPIVEAEAARCRHKFWAQALFVSNFYQPDEKCLIQTWFVAVEMQLYIVAAILTLVLGRWRRAAIKIFGSLFILSIVALFLISYQWQLKSVLFLMKPEIIRNQLSDEKSFDYMYTAPWGSLPASLLGLFLAFLQYHLDLNGFQANKYVLLKIAYRMSVPLMFTWMVSGYWFQELVDPVAVSLYTALDRSVFIILVAICFLGLINYKDDIWHNFLSWRGFRILGRMSLAILLLHWSYNLSVIAGRTLPTQSTVMEMVGDTFTASFLTHLSAIPASLLIEFPLQKMFTVMLTGSG